MTAASPAIAQTGRLVRLPAAFAIAVGLLIVYGAGFAFPTALHNATHDTRHAFGLPCH